MMIEMIGKLGSHVRRAGQQVDCVWRGARAETPPTCQETRGDVVDSGSAQVHSDPWREVVARSADGRAERTMRGGKDDVRHA